ncbi:helix-turn-helix transcriptional regulator [Spirosoma aureum]|uniref:Helix-turn-helix transcriptional regulator n=1 Tax=Spirosoma aureum TaxID=2692134 RepID=A0A6G9AUM6_9BACT|nr:AraC family transcriptional regulator [Spirosoma aureum]QIP15913.1 helix-turn-helix transcriptional regulator [Spirosoma aureum]
MTTYKLPHKIAARQHEITADFMAVIDRHLADLLEGRVTDMYEIRDIADELHIHPTHLSNTIKLTTGQSPCYFFENKIMAIARTMLRDNRRTIADIAMTLTFDPSNFTKFFKRFQGVTPRQYREAILQEAWEKTEAITI